MDTTSENYNEDSSSSMTARPLMTPHSTNQEKSRFAGDHPETKRRKDLVMKVGQRIRKKCSSGRSVPPSPRRQILGARTPETHTENEKKRHENKGFFVSRIPLRLKKQKMKRRKRRKEVEVGFLFWSKKWTRRKRSRRRIEEDSI